LANELSPIVLTPGKKVFFASDFHLGAPNKEQSRERERKIVRWLDSISPNAAAIFLMGDLFDFWFEYRHAVPKGGIRLQGKLAELSDSGLPIIIFTGNHDMWMKNYFPEEFGIPVYKNPRSLTIGERRFFMGHGDGLGPGDTRFKVMKKVFQSPLSHWLYSLLHPDIGIGIAQKWSGRSRASNHKKDEVFLGDKEWLLAYCRYKQQQEHHDYYVFGHRHLPLHLEVDADSHYINLGEWINYYTYGEFDGHKMELKTFEEDIR
jgi:UDP-2,3-diacylglucosamine hydrolase